MAITSALVTLLLLAPAARAAEGPEVLLVGAEVAAQTAPYLERYLPKMTVVAVTKPGSNPAKLRTLAEGHLERRRPSVVVFDASSHANEDPLEVIGDLNAVASLAGRACMVVPTSSKREVGEPDVEYRNKAIFEFAETRPGTRVPEWFGLTELHPGLLRRGSPVPTRAGAEQRARLLAAQIERCATVGGGGEPRLPRKPAEQTTLTQTGAEIAAAYRRLADELIQRAAITLLVQILLP